MKSRKNPKKSYAKGLGPWLIFEPRSGGTWAGSFGSFNSLANALAYTRKASYEKINRQAAIANEETGAVYNLRGALLAENAADLGILTPSGAPDDMSPTARVIAYGTAGVVVGAILAKIIL